MDRETKDRAVQALPQRQRDQLLRQPASLVERTAFRLRGRADRQRPGELERVALLAGERDRANMVVESAVCVAAGVANQAADHPEVVLQGVGEAALALGDQGFGLVESALPAPTDE